jgi:hypothetical protein
LERLGDSAPRNLTRNQRNQRKGRKINGFGDFARAVTRNGYRKNITIFGDFARVLDL